MEQRFGSGTVWRERVLTFLYFVITGLILVLPALENKSPLVYADSGAYMAHMVHLRPMSDRPIGYSLIMRAVTWQASLWPMIFFQGCVASWLIFRVMGQVVRRGDPRKAHVLTLFLLLLTSSLPWYASQLMPDALTGLLACTTFLLFFGKGIRPAQLALLWALQFFFVLSHFSHMAMLLALVGALPLVRRSGALRTAFGSRFFLNWAILAITVFGTMLFTREHRAAHGEERALSPSADLFLAAKLCESGVMYEHLVRTCADRHHGLCDHLDELDNGAVYFVWDERSPMAHPGGQVAASRAIAPLLGEVLSDPRNWGLLVWSSFTGTLIQIAQVEIGSGLHAYGRETSAWYPYDRTHHHELPMYMESRQQRNGLDFGTVNTLCTLSLLLSLMTITWYWRDIHVRLRALIVLSTSILFLNAATTAILANIYERLQARATWLVVLCAILVVLERWYARRTAAAA